MKIHGFISTIARLNTSDERFDQKALSMEAITSDSAGTLDSVIALARDLDKACRAPTRNFVEGNWAFRCILMNGQPGYFELFPKGQRSHWASRGSMRLASDGLTWMYTVFHNGTGSTDARPSFAEAKAEVLRLLGHPER